MLAIDQNSPQGRVRRETLLQAAVYRPEQDFSFVCFGKNYKGQTDINWSVGPLQRAEDAAKHPELCQRWASICRALGVSRVLAPSPVPCNARYISPSLLKNEVPLAQGISLWRNKDQPADVSTLEPGEGGAFSAGGCPLIVAKRGDTFAFAHAGRWSLIDQARVRGNGGPYRLNESVVDTVVQKLRAPQGASDMRIWIYGSLHPSRYPHPLSGQYAEFNMDMRRYAMSRWPGSEEAMPIKDSNMYLDLPRLMQAQFQAHGISAKCLDLNHAYLTDESQVWLDGKVGEPRNAFIVMRH